MANSDKNIRITGNRGAGTGTNPKIVFTGSSAGSSVITLEVLDDNTLSFTSNEGQIFSLDSNLSTGTIWSVNDISGYPLLRADVGAAAGATIRIAEGLGNVGIGETNPIHKFNVKGALAIGSTTTGSYTVFRFPAAGSGQTYILPSAYPGTGTSILQSDTTGNLLWVAAASGAGGGSGTTSLNVNVTTASTNASHRVLFTPATTTVAGAALSTESTFVYNPSTDILSVSGISAADNIEIKSAKELRLNNSGNTFYTGIKAGSVAANNTLTLPIANPGAGTSILVSDSTGAMAFVPLIGLGVSSFASNSAVSITHLEPFMVTFCSGYTPTGAGADTVVFRFPENVVDGSSSIVYSLRRVQMRVETLSSGTSTIRLEKYGWNAGVGTGAFSTTSTGSTANVMSVPLNIGGVGMGETFVTSASIGFSANGTSFVSGDKLRVNFTTLNATHANFTITALVDTVS